MFVDTLFSPSQKMYRLAGKQKYSKKHGALFMYAWVVAFFLIASF